MDKCEWYGEMCIMWIDGENCMNQRDFVKKYEVARFTLGKHDGSHDVSEKLPVSLKNRFLVRAGTGN